MQKQKGTAQVAITPKQASRFQHLLMRAEEKNFEYPLRNIALLNHTVAMLNAVQKAQAQPLANAEIERVCFALKDGAINAQRAGEAQTLQGAIRAITKAKASQRKTLRIATPMLMGAGIIIFAGAGLVAGFAGAHMVYAGIMGGAPFAIGALAPWITPNDLKEAKSAAAAKIDNFIKNSIAKKAEISKNAECIGI